MQGDGMFHNQERGSSFQSHPRNEIVKLSIVLYCIVLYCIVFHCQATLKLPKPSKNFVGKDLRLVLKQLGHHFGQHVHLEICPGEKTASSNHVRGFKVLWYLLMLANQCRSQPISLFQLCCQTSEKKLHAPPVGQAWIKLDAGYPESNEDS